VPWRPVNPRADGFLSLLQLKNLGRNPEALLENIQPQLDMLPWYLASQAITDVQGEEWPSTNNILTGFYPPGLGASTQQQVPAGQYWYVLETTATMNWVGASAGNVIANIATAIQFPRPNAAPHYLLGVNTAYGWSNNPMFTYSTMQVGARSLRNVLLPPGARLGVFSWETSVADSGGNPINYNISIHTRYVPLLA